VGELRAGPPANETRVTSRAEPERSLDRGSLHRLSTAPGDQRLRQLFKALDGPLEAISAKPQVEAEEWRPSPDQRLQAFGFSPEVPTRIGQGVERLDIVLAGKADDGVPQ